MHLGFINQAHMVPLAFQAPKGTLESQAIYIQDLVVQMEMMVIQGLLGIRAYLVLLKIEVCMKNFF